MTCVHDDPFCEECISDSIARPEKRTRRIPEPTTSRRACVACLSIMAQHEREFCDVCTTKIRRGRAAYELMVEDRKWSAELTAREQSMEEAA